MRILSSVKYWILFLGVIILLFIGVTHKFSLTSRNIRAEVENLLVKCGKGGSLNANALDYTCFRKGLTSMVSKNTLEPIAASLEDIFLSQEVNKTVGALSCHGPAHILGEIAYAKGISETDILNLCDRRCDYGCVHGAFLEMVNETPNFLGDYKTVCDKYKNSAIVKDLSSCYHIMGHGLVDIVNRDVSRAINLCDGLNGTDNQRSCVDGALMEFLLGSSEGTVPFDTSKNDIVTFCSTVPTKYAGVCYAYVGFYGYTLMDNKGEAPKACERVPLQFRNSCFEKLGVRTYYAFRSSYDDFRNYCSKQGQYRLDCLLGGIEADVDEGTGFAESRYICSQETGINRQTCYSFYGDRLEYSQGLDYRRNTCLNLQNKSDQTSCLNKSNEKYI